MSLRLLWQLVDTYRVGRAFRDPSNDPLNNTNFPFNNKREDSATKTHQTTSLQLLPRGRKIILWHFYLPITLIIRNLKFRFKFLPLSSPCLDSISVGSDLCWIERDWPSRLTSSWEWAEFEIGGVTGGLWSDPIGGEMDIGGAFMLIGLKLWLKLGWCGWRPMVTFPIWWGWCVGWNCGRCWCWWADMTPDMSRGLRISWILNKPLAQTFMPLAKSELNPDGSVPRWPGCIFWIKCIPRFQFSTTHLILRVMLMELKSDRIRVSVERQWVKWRLSLKGGVHRETERFRGSCHQFFTQR